VADLSALRGLYAPRRRRTLNQISKFFTQKGDKQSAETRDKFIALIG